MNEERLWDFLGQIDDKVDDLCERMATLEERVDNHLKHQESKFNKTTVILGIVVAVVAIVVAIK